VGGGPGGDRPGGGREQGRQGHGQSVAAGGLVSERASGFSIGVIEFNYGDGLDPAEAQRRLRIWPKAYATERLAALQAMVELIYAWVEMRTGAAACRPRRAVGPRMRAGRPRRPPSPPGGPARPPRRQRLPLLERQGAPRRRPRRCARALRPLPWRRWSAARCSSARGSGRRAPDGHRRGRRPGPRDVDWTG
jgi:hypothetical protein